MQALKEEGRVDEAEKAFDRVLGLDDPSSPSVAALRIMAQMRQQKGDHAGAIEILDKAIKQNKEEQVGGWQGAPPSVCLALGSITMLLAEPSCLLHYATVQYHHFIRLCHA